MDGPYIIINRGRNEPSCLEPEVVVGAGRIYHEYRGCRGESINPSNLDRFHRTRTLLIDRNQAVNVANNIVSSRVKELAYV